MLVPYCDALNAELFVNASGRSEGVESTWHSTRPQHEVEAVSGLRWRHSLICSKSDGGFTTIKHCESSS